MLKVITKRTPWYVLSDVGLTCRMIHASSSRLNFWEPDRKSGYKTKIDMSQKQQVQQGLKLLKGEFSKFKDEVNCKFRCDNAVPLQHGDYEVVWNFNNQSAVDDWVVTSDKDHNEGKSTAEFILGTNRHGMFRGCLDTTVPKDGIIKNAGYCNVRSPTNMISFKRVRTYDWNLFTHLVMRVRGDGRSYQIILNMERNFDLQWNDQYSYPLFTRGGPYWQTAKIPFSKFILNAKGRIQDKQEAIQLDQIRNVGITLADAVSGPFQLEIDYIAVVYDSSHPHSFEYEMFPVSTAVFS